MADKTLQALFLVFGTQSLTLHLVKAVGSPPV